MGIWKEKEGETELKPIDTVKVRGGISERRRDGAVHREMEIVGKKDMEIGETERRSIRNVYRYKSSAARRRTKTFTDYRTKSFNETYMEKKNAHKEEPEQMNCVLSGTKKQTVKRTMYGQQNRSMLVTTSDSLLYRQIYRVTVCTYLALN